MEKQEIENMIDQGIAILVQAEKAIKEKESIYPIRQQQINKDIFNVSVSLKLALQETKTIS